MKVEFRLPPELVLSPSCLPTHKLPVSEKLEALAATGMDYPPPGLTLVLRDDKQLSLKAAAQPIIICERHCLSPYLELEAVPGVTFCLV